MSVMLSRIQPSASCMASELQTGPDPVGLGRGRHVAAVVADTRVEERGAAGVDDVDESVADRPCTGDRSTANSAHKPEHAAHCTGDHLQDRYRT